MYNKTRQVETEAFVMNGSLYEGPLLSEATLLDLGCIKYDLEGKFQPPNRFTDAKSLVPLLNKASRKTLPRIERKILGMQHLDFTLVYSPADFISRNPSDTESSYLDKVTDELEESIIKMVKSKEKAGLSNNLKDATMKHKLIIFLKERILQGDWKKHKKNSLINQFYSVRDNLRLIDDVIYMNDLCVPPYALRENVVQKIHEMGHLGETEGLDLLRQI